MRTPASDLLQACAALEGLFPLLESRHRLRGRDEHASTGEALNLLEFSLGHVHGVLALARQARGELLPSAHSASRAALETAVKGAWLVDHNEALVREARWMAHIAEEERVLERAAQRLENTAVVASLVERATKLRQLRLAAESDLPLHVTRVRSLPTVEELLSSVEARKFYPGYILSSQFIHGGHLATHLLRREGATASTNFSCVVQADWLVPLLLCCFSLSKAGGRVLFRLGDHNAASLAKRAGDAVARKVYALERHTHRPAERYDA